jgi:hypothetical protein
MGISEKVIEQFVVGVRPDEFKTMCSKKILKRLSEAQEASGLHWRSVIAFEGIIEHTYLSLSKQKTFSNAAVAHIFGMVEHAERNSRPAAKCKKKHCDSYS